MLKIKFNKSDKVILESLFQAISNNHFGNLQIPHI